MFWFQFEFKRSQAVFICRLSTSNVERLFVCALLLFKKSLELAGRFIYYFFDVSAFLALFKIFGSSWCARVFIPKLPWCGVWLIFLIFQHLSFHLRTDRKQCSLNSFLLLLLSHLLQSHSIAFLWFFLVSLFFSNLLVCFFTRKQMIIWRMQAMNWFSLMKT